MPALRDSIFSASGVDPPGGPDLQGVAEVFLLLIRDRFGLDQLLIRFRAAAKRSFATDGSWRAGFGSI